MEENTFSSLDKLLDSFFIQLLIKELTVQAVYLGGSYAREEAKADSDIDLYVFFREELNVTHLSKMGEIIKLLRKEYLNLEINAQCLSTKEFSNPAFSNFLCKPIMYFEAIKVYGDFTIPAPSKAEIIERMQCLLAEALLSVRHYISVNEKSEQLTNKKIQGFILKPVIISLKLRQFILGKEYPLTTEALCSVIEPRYKEIVLWHQRSKKLQKIIQKDSQYFLKECHTLLMDLLAEEYK